MQTATTRVPDDILPILARSTIAGNVLTLPGQLDRATYLRVSKALAAAQGKWDRKAKGHVFPFDPAVLIAGMAATGTVTDARKALGFFETPPKLAGAMADLALIRPGDAELEPSAGRGRIVRMLLRATTDVTAVEIDRENVSALREAFPSVTTCGEDFLGFAARETARFNAIVMNPPFAAGQDMRHVRAAWNLLRPGGRLVAVCCEGPFFREDKASRTFRAWLDSIGAVARKRPDRSFRDSGTDVATRLVTAHMPGAAGARARAHWTGAGVPTGRQDGLVAGIAAKAAPGAAVGPFRLPAAEASAPGPFHDPVPAPDAQVVNLPMSQVRPDPGQPRKIFDPAALRELARSIKADGLLQPVTVRRTGDAYQIVAGERRYRAHELIGAATVRAIVIETTGTADIRVKQIIENDQRVDVTPLEQARSYQSLMDQSGWTIDELAARIGKDPWRVRERTVLLTLRPEYQELLAGGNLTPSQATELARLGPRGQDALFKLIRTGGCRTYNDLRAAATAILSAEAQTSLLAEAPKPTAQERQAVASFEDAVARVGNLLRASIRDNHVTAVRKVDPHRAGNLADLIGEMQKDLRRIELALRETAIQAGFLAAG
jgi:ParB/RepB/Spo0J family partition protein